MCVEDNNLEIIRKEVDATEFHVLSHDLPEGTEESNKNRGRTVGVLGWARHTVAVRTCTSERPKRAEEVQSSQNASRLTTAPVQHSVSYSYPEQ